MGRGRPPHKPKRSRTAVRRSILQSEGAESVTAKFCAAIEMGLPIADAANFVGISVMTVRSWIARGRRHRKELLDAEQQRAAARNRPVRDLQPNPSRKEHAYWRFANAYEKASAACVHGLVKSVRDAANDGKWQAAQFMLVSSRPESFRKTPKVEFNVNRTLTIKDDFQHLSTEAIEAALGVKAITDKEDDVVDIEEDVVEAEYTEIQKNVQ